MGVDNVQAKKDFRIQQTLCQLITGDPTQLSCNTNHNHFDRVIPLGQGMCLQNKLII